MNLFLVVLLGTAVVMVFGYLLWLAFFDNDVYYEDCWDDDDDQS